MRKLPGFERFRTRPVTPENLNAQLQISRKISRFEDLSFLKKKNVFFSSKILNRGRRDFKVEISQVKIEDDRTFNDENRKEITSEKHHSEKNCLRRYNRINF